MDPEFHLSKPKTDDGFKASVIIKEKIFLNKNFKKLKIAC